MEEKTIINGIYSLEEKIAEGGMAAVFRASVDLTRFDYTRLYAYTQVQGETHRERSKKAEEFAAKIEEKSLDIATIRSILEAHDIPLPDSVVAVKVAKSGMESDRFEAEWRNLLWLNHENVIKVYDGGEYMKRPFYVMELIENMITPDRITSEFSFSDRISTVIDAAKGLAYLHEKGLVHRDVKPDNFITSQNADGEFVTKVTDLGLAKNVNDSLGLTSSGSMMGTPYYMPPEQIESSKDVDFKADIYSLGASLYDLLIGRPPYHDKTSVYEIIAAVTKGEKPIRPQDHVPWFPAVLDAIISCAMAWSPEQRYQSMNEFIQDMKTYLEEENPEFLGTIILEEAKENAGKTTAQMHQSMYNFETIIVQKAQTIALPDQTADTILQNEPAAEEKPDLSQEQMDQTQDTFSGPPQESAGKQSRLLLYIIIFLLICGLGVGGYFIYEKRQQNRQKNIRETAREPIHKAGDKLKNIHTDETAETKTDIVTNPKPKIVAPREHYIKAKRDESVGDIKGAIESYEAFFASGQDLIDPYISYMEMVKMQEGIEGARSRFRKLKVTDKTMACRLTDALLQEKNERISGLENLLKEEADYGPAAYALSLEYSPGNVGEQTAQEKGNELHYLKLTEKLDSDGHLIRYYIDRKSAGEIRKDIDTRMKMLADFEKMIREPVKINTSFGNAGWNVAFSFPDNKFKDITFMLEGGESYKSTGKTSYKDPVSGDLMPNTTIQLPRNQKKTVIYLKYINVKGIENGPFQIEFDPQKEYTRFAKGVLPTIATSWVSLTKLYGQLTINNTILQSYRNGIKEARYSIDKPVLDQVFTMLPDGLEISDPLVCQVKVSQPGKTIFVQITYRDGTKSEVIEFDVPNE